MLASPRRWFAILAALVSIGSLGFFGFRRLAADPSVIWLAPEQGAQWIRLAEPFDLGARLSAETFTLFRKRFTVGVEPKSAHLVVRALKVVRVYLDGKPLYEPRNEPDRWKETREIELPGRLTRGSHEIVFGVQSSNTHPALLASIPELGLATGSNWDASGDRRTWSVAEPVTAFVDVPLARDAPGAMASIAKLWPFLLILFSGVFAITIFRARGALSSIVLDAARLRWILLAAWAVLAANNIFKLPAHFGFDYSAHLEYIRYVSERGSLPLANQGLQMFQAPLYYLLSAPLFGLSSVWHNGAPEQYLRVVPLACGMLQVELGYSMMRRAFPDRDDLQALGTCVAGLLPMSLYISQSIGNEPLSGVLSAGVLLLCLRWITRSSSAEPFEKAWQLGACLGLALLAKMTAILLVPVVLASVAWASRRERASPRQTLIRVSVVAGTSLLVAGWFYARNWIELGHPFIGGWDWKVSNSPWWQDPGYRTAEHFLRFGRAIEQPVLATVDGFWDALYSSLWTDGTLSSCMFLPPWNLSFMCACGWLALPVVIAMFAGAILPAPTNAHRARLLAVTALFFYLTALAYMYLKLPIYSIAKATYMLGLTPCFGLLAAVGFRPLLENRYARAMVYGWVACLGVCAYLAYFVV